MMSVDAAYSSDKLNSGACEKGECGFLFQLQPSGATSVTFIISNPVGFVADAAKPNYAVQICDNNDPVNCNTLAVCTTATAGQIPNIAFTTNPTSPQATFSISSFSDFPAVPDHEGRGLTIFVQTHQSTAIPIGFPTISILELLETGGQGSEGKHGSSAG
jgi:hypothetical protein